MTSPSASLRVEVYDFHRPANTAKGRLSSKANHTGTALPSPSRSFSLNEVNGTTQREAGPSQRRQCGEPTLRMLVTPLSTFRP